MTKAWFRDLEGPGAATILVVDDLEVNRAVLTRRLVKQGYRVVEAASGPEALARIEESMPDLVLLDMMMPDMSGLQVIEMLRAQHTPSALPIIMVTARSETELIVEALEAGANDYIQKPVNFPVLLARMVTQIARQRAERNLRSANDALDRRVAERALELHEARAELSVKNMREHENAARLAQLQQQVEALSAAGNALRQHLASSLTPLVAAIASQAERADAPADALQRIKPLVRELETALRDIAGAAPPPFATVARSSIGQA
ncbi:MAG: response regulator [Alphaproteobacteria bacterium]|nr:MAG: response regulator [Alphaproteobacteria bacterium]